MVLAFTYFYLILLQPAQQPVVTTTESSSLNLHIDFQMSDDPEGKNLIMFYYIRKKPTAYLIFR